MQRHFLKNGKILDVKARKVLTGSSIFIEGSEIIRVGSVEELGEIEKTLLSETILDLDGRLIMPGLIDSHVHLCHIQGSEEIDTLTENLRATDTLKVLHGARNARETLESGFTTVRDVGQGDNLALREAIERGIITGPRIVACGWLGMAGGHQQRMTSEWRFGVRPRQEDLGVDGPWDVRRRVRKLVGQGVDCIKTYTSGSGGIRHPFYPYWLEYRNFTPEEMEALVDESHTAGRRVAAHTLVSNEGVKLAIWAGVDTLEHGVLIREEDAREMQKKGIIYVPTLAVIRAMWDVKGQEKIKYLRISEEDALRYVEEHQASFQRAHDCGVKIAMGSDTFRVLRHGGNACELKAMVEAGMSEMEAIVSATKIASEALGIESLLGTVEEGKLADLLVVDPNPLDDISVLLKREHLKLIMKNGEVIVSRP